MKLFIVKEEKEYKIFRVAEYQESAFQKEYGKKILIEGSNLSEVINKFQELDITKMHIHSEISCCKQDSHEEGYGDHLDQKRKQLY